MKARNEKGVIKVYSQEQFQSKFNFYNNTHLWYTSPKETLEAEGFYDVVIPEILQGEKLGAIYFDEAQGIYTYPIEQIQPKTQAEIDAELDAILTQQKQAKFEELRLTDWYIVRKIETGIAVPLDILTQREEIRNRYN